MIDEVDSFLFRPHLGLRAKYNAVNFLSQIDLSHKEDGPKVAKRLIDVYFALFKVHSQNFNVGIQALMLLDKISSKNLIVSDRFYRALYAKFLVAAVMNTSKIALQQPAQYACACLLLLSEVLKARPPLWNMVDQNESGHEYLEHFKDFEEETDNIPSTASEKPQSDDGFVCNSNIVDSSDSSQTEEDSPASYSVDVLEEDDDLLVRDGAKKIKESKTESAVDGHKSEVSTLRSFLSAGYNPRHREPSFCNANRVSWWELMALASHVHPSATTMARTLLSGANIVYNGNPLDDLSLNAFLDKFMEKKPKPSMWHGGSQIEPAKKIDMNNHLIGAEILSMAEVDVPPEDFVFHKFYMNKMSSLKKPKKKKKKKGPEDDTAEEFLQGDAGDESDNEEIENMVDSVDLLLEQEGGDYDYDDLDQIANEDDDGLVGEASDAEMDIPFDIAEGENFDATADEDERSDDVIGGIVDADEGSDEEEGANQRKRKRKRKSGRYTGVSPFASLEDYEHLLDEDTPKKKASNKKKPQLLKKRKSSD